MKKKVIFEGDSFEDEREFHVIDKMNDISYVLWQLCMNVLPNFLNRPNIKDGVSGDFKLGYYNAVNGIIKNVNVLLKNNDIDVEKISW